MSSAISQYSQLPAFSSLYFLLLLIFIQNKCCFFFEFELKAYCLTGFRELLSSPYRRHSGLKKMNV